MMWVQAELPFAPAEYDADVVYAVRALNEGIASEGQQKLVWEWLMYVTGFGDWAFRPDARNQELVLGKQFVGFQFQKMLSPAISEWLKSQDAKPPRRPPQQRATKTAPRKKPARKRPATKRKRKT